MVSLAITRGVMDASAVKAVCYGPEGVGKTTFASKWPNAVFIDLEDGSTRYDVARIGKPDDWQRLISVISSVASSNGEVGTLVIDTADAAEALATAHVCKTRNFQHIEDAGYGKGYVYLADEFSKMLDALSKCVENGINVLVLAHSQIKKFEQPDEMGAYDRYELKLAKKCAPLLKEWADVLLFANFKTDVMHDEKSGKVRASGGTRRVMYTQHTAAYDAKNRLGLEPQLPFEFDAIAEHVAGGSKRGYASLEPKKEPETPVEAPADAETPAEPDSEPEKDVSDVFDGARVEDVTPENVKELHRLMERDGVNEAMLVLAIAERPNNRYTQESRIADFSEKFVDSLVKNWASVSESAKAKLPYAQEYIPF